MPSKEAESTISSTASAEISYKEPAPTLFAIPRKNYDLNYLQIQLKEVQGKIEKDHTTIKDIEDQFKKEQGTYQNWLEKLNNTTEEFNKLMTKPRQHNTFQREKFEREIDRLEKNIQFANEVFSLYDPTMEKLHADLARHLATEKKLVAKIKKFKSDNDNSPRLEIIDEKKPVSSLSR